jgi:hypothetical protein
MSKFLRGFIRYRDAGNVKKFESVEPRYDLAHTFISELGARSTLPVASTGKTAASSATRPLPIRKSCGKSIGVRFVFFFAIHEP